MELCKALLAALEILLMCGCVNGASVEFENRSIDSWILHIGGNGQELLFNFCQRNVSANRNTCKSVGEINEVCGCFTHFTGVHEGAYSLVVNCGSNSGICPQDFAVSYHQGIETIKAGTTEEARCSIFTTPFVVLSVLLILSLLVHLYTFNLYQKRFQSQSQPEIPLTTSVEKGIKPSTTHPFTHEPYEVLTEDANVKSQLILGNPSEQNNMC